MNPKRSLPAFITYLLPVVGWIYVYIFENKNQFARFHMRQSVGLILFLAVVTAGWGLLTWLLAWIPYMYVFGIALFALPVVSYVFAVIAWIMGMANALRERQVNLPLIGGYCSRLPL